MSTADLTIAGGVMRPARKIMAAGAGIVALAVLPLAVHSPYVVNIASLALFFAVISTALNLIYGYAGLLSFAQVGFWGLGGYVSAIVVTTFQVSPWLGFAAAGFAGGAMALLIGFPMLRVSRDAFVIVTLSFTLLLQLLARNWLSVTHGPMGIPGLPAPSVHLPGIGPIDGADPANFYWIALVFSLVMLGFFWRLFRSRIGLTLLAINQDEQLARSQGVQVRRYQLLAFAVSATVTSMAGALFVSHLTIVDPTIFDVYYTQMILIIVILGGPGHFWPVLASSVIFTFLPELLRLAPELRMVLFGGVLVLAVLFAPRGLGGILAERRHRKWRAGRSA